MLVIFIVHCNVVNNYSETNWSITQHGHNVDYTVSYMKT